MELLAHDTIDRRLLEDWQRSLPLVSRPFLSVASALGIPEREVIDRLRRLQASGIIARVGGVVRPNTLGASTLAAIKAPDLEIDQTAAVLADEPGVNHVYLRENDLNLWFVATGPDRDFVEATLERISRRTHLPVLDLRLTHAYHIDLGFRLTGEGEPRDGHRPHEVPGQPFDMDPGDRRLVQWLTTGLPLVPAPFSAIAGELGRSEDEVIARLATLSATGVVPRIGVIVRHRALGWRSNAMVVWDVPPDLIDTAGAALAARPGINLCYSRMRYEREWPYNLYCMVHGRTRDEAFRTLNGAILGTPLEPYPRQVLFSLRCFKQTGAMVDRPREVA